MKLETPPLEELMLQWEKDSEVDTTEPGKEILWEPFRFTLKSDMQVYLDGDEDLNKMKRKKAYHEEAANFCTNVMKELNNRTWQLKEYMGWEKFIQGAR